MTRLVDLYGPVMGPIFSTPELEAIMLQRKLVVMALAAATLLPAGYALADNDENAPPRATERKQVRGSEMMTREERAEHRKKMREAGNREEREQVRKEQHERMKERAKEQGKEMPDQPPERGMHRMDGSGPRDGGGMGPGGGGMGGGMGPGGGGMGPGGNRGR